MYVAEKVQQLTKSAYSVIQAIEDTLAWDPQCIAPTIVTAMNYATRSERERIDSIHVKNAFN